mmetsp:Transcript_4914/g.12372  ORF Transcript_4914/g.12372 Transcript_4914/m.12372 type:complete len:493 (+) Transcript_4914:102-1580(+)
MMDASVDRSIGRSLVLLSLVVSVTLFGPGPLRGLLLLEGAQHLLHVGIRDVDSRQVGEHAGDKGLVFEHGAQAAPASTGRGRVCRILLRGLGRLLRGFWGRFFLLGLRHRGHHLPASLGQGHGQGLLQDGFVRHLHVAVGVHPLLLPRRISLTRGALSRRHGSRSRGGRSHIRRRALAAGRCRLAGRLGLAASVLLGWGAVGVVVVRGGVRFPLALRLGLLARPLLLHAHAQRQGELRVQVGVHPKLKVVAPTAAAAAHAATATRPAAAGAVALLHEDGRRQENVTQHARARRHRHQVAAVVRVDRREEGIQLGLVLGRGLLAKAHDVDAHVVLLQLLGDLHQGLLLLDQRRADEGDDALPLVLVLPVLERQLRDLHPLDERDVAFRFDLLHAGQDPAQVRRRSRKDLRPPQASEGEHPDGVFRVGSRLRSGEEVHGLRLSLQARRLVVLVDHEVRVVHTDNRRFEHHLCCRSSFPSNSLAPPPPPVRSLDT